MALVRKRFVAIVGASLILTACVSAEKQNDTGTVTNLTCSKRNPTIQLDENRKYRLWDNRWCGIPTGAKVKIEYNDRLIVTALDYVKEESE